MELLGVAPSKIATLQGMGLEAARPANPDLAQPHLHFGGQPHLILPPANVGVGNFASWLLAPIGPARSEEQLALGQVRHWGVEVTSNQNGPATTTPEDLQHHLQIAAELRSLVRVRPGVAVHRGGE